MQSFLAAALLVVPTVASDPVPSNTLSSNRLAHRREWQRKHNASEYSTYWLKTYAANAVRDNGSFFMNWGYMPVTEEWYCAELPDQGASGRLGCQMYAHVLRSGVKVLGRAARWQRCTQRSCRKAHA